MCVAVPVSQGCNTSDDVVRDTIHAIVITRYSRNHAFDEGIAMSMVTGVPVLTTNVGANLSGHIRSQLPFVTHNSNIDKSALRSFLEECKRSASKIKVKDDMWRDIGRVGDDYSTFVKLRTCTRTGDESTVKKDTDAMALMKAWDIPHSGLLRVIEVHAGHRMVHVTHPDLTRYTGPFSDDSPCWTFDLEKDLECSTAQRLENRQDGASYSDVWLPYDLVFPFIEKVMVFSKWSSSVVIDSTPLGHFRHLEDALDCDVTYADGQLEISKSSWYPVTTSFIRSDVDQIMLIDFSPAPHPQRSHPLTLTMTQYNLSSNAICAPVAILQCSPWCGCPSAVYPVYVHAGVVYRMKVDAPRGYILSTSCQFADKLSTFANKPNSFVSKNAFKYPEKHAIKQLSTSRGVVESPSQSMFGLVLNVIDGLSPEPSSSPSTPAQTDGIKTPRESRMPSTQSAWQLWSRCCISTSSANSVIVDLEVPKSVKFAAELKVYKIINDEIPCEMAVNFNRTEAIPLGITDQLVVIVHAMSPKSQCTCDSMYIHD